LGWIWFRRNPPFRNDVCIQVEILLIASRLRDLICAAKVAVLIHPRDFAEQSDSRCSYLLNSFLQSRRVQLGQKFVARFQPASSRAPLRPYSDPPPGISLELLSLHRVGFRRTNTERPRASRAGLSGPSLVDVELALSRAGLRPAREDYLSFQTSFKS
jgi:hypothetical protein